MEKKIYLNQCDQNFKYLFKVLNDKNIPLTKKKELTYSILMKYLDLKTATGRIRFILCITTILYIFSKSGRISKQIIRRLQSYGVEVDPELIMAAS